MLINFLFRISSGDTNEVIPKPVIFIDAGIHCREWIAPPVALYIIQQLVENPENSWLIQNVTWYVVPNLNPDGYEYSQTHVSTAYRVFNCYHILRQYFTLLTEKKTS